MNTQSIQKQFPGITYGKSSLQTTPLAQVRYGNNLSLASIASLEKLAALLQQGGSIADFKKESIATVRAKPRIKIKDIEETTCDILSYPIKNWAKEIIFQLWHKNESNKLIDSRFVVCTFAKTTDESTAPDHPIYLFDRIFGNVDLIVVPDIREHETKRIITVSSKTERLDQYIKLLERRHLTNISRYLDHGQTIHIANVLDQVTKNKLKGSSKDPYKQVLIDYISQMHLAPHGKILTKKSSDVLNLLHETVSKEKIIASNELRVSSSGCLGSVVYCTQSSEFNDALFNSKSKPMIMSGHSIGINRRMHDGAINKDYFLSIHIKNIANNKTNLIERSGFGRLWLECYLQIIAELTVERNQIAHQRQEILEDDPKYTDIDNRYLEKTEELSLITYAEKDSVILYNGLYDLFACVREYHQSKKALLEARLINNPHGDTDSEKVV